MDKILIIPDVHGRTFWKKAIELIDTVDKVVFLGDYLDPYSHENISSLDAINNFEEIIAFKKKYCDKIVLLLGNHDLHYWPKFKTWWGCRRIDSSFDYISKLFLDNIDLFQISYKLDKYLFTHAGVLNGWLKLINGISKIGDSTYAELMEFPQPIITLDNLNTLLEIPYGLDMLFMVSRERGGNFEYGSCMWADVFEHTFVDSVDPNIYQIFGHTMMTPSIYKPLIRHNFAMLDSQHCYILNIDTGEFTEEEMD